MKPQAIAGVLLVVLLTGVAAFFYLHEDNTSGEESKTQTLKVGAILPETNKNFASYASQLKKGMILAEELINSDTGKNLEVIYEDGFGNPSKSISAFNKLTDLNNVNFVIGPMFSNSAESLAPISLQKQVVLLSPSASSIALSNAGKYFFRIYPSDSYDGVFLASVVNSKLKAQKVAIVYENSSSINQIVDVFKQNVNSHIALQEAVNDDNSINPISSIIVRLKDLKPDAIFFPGNKSFMTTFLRKAKEQSLNSQFITISTFNDEEIINIAKSTAEGVIFSTPAFDLQSQTNEMTKFIDKYSQKYGELPGILAGYGYDVVNIAYAAAKQASNTDEIIVNLHNIKNYKGVTGNSMFDENGDIIKELQIMTVKDGLFVKYE